MELRKEVEWFAFEMEEVLRENDHKKGLFDDMSMDDLLSRLEGELKELKHAIRVIENYYHTLRNQYFVMENLTDEEKSIIKKEAIDVANYAMATAWSVRK